MEKLRNRLVTGRARRRQNNQTEGARVVLRFILREERGVMVKRRCSVMVKRWFPSPVRGREARERHAR
jgi:hypothetical protein